MVNHLNYLNKRYLNLTVWGLIGLGIGYGMLLIAKVWFWQYFINPPLIFSNLSHAIIFGCESTVSPMGEPVVIFPCNANKIIIGEFYKNVTYFLGWIIIGLGTGSVRQHLKQNKIVD